jgi:hypothetical protein
MKPASKILLTVLFVFAAASASFAADLQSIDRTSVLMTKNQVTAILGAPDAVTDMGGLTVELYLVPSGEPLVSVGYIYEDDRYVAGHTFIFTGKVAAQTAARMKAIGFTSLEEKGDYFRLAGKDDDTGRPIVVTIGLINDLTTVTTFEKGFYERRANR